MLPKYVVLEIDRLLRENRWSHRRIARTLGVSHGVVGAIARGERGLHGRDAPLEVFDFHRRDLPAKRCPGCGGLVYFPCVLCRTRRALQQPAPTRRLRTRRPRVRYVA